MNDDLVERSLVGAGFVPRAGVVALTVVHAVAATLLLITLWSFWPTALSPAPEERAPSQQVGATSEPKTAAETRESTAGEDRSAARRSVDYLGLVALKVPVETLFFLIVALSGALGGLIHAIRSLAVYIGTRRLRWSWIPYYVLRPVVGALGGTVFYLVLRAGLFSPSTAADQASPFGFAAVAVLVGLFSEEAMNKLRQVAENLFVRREPGPDHHDDAER